MRAAATRVKAQQWARIGCASTAWAVDGRLLGTMADEGRSGDELVELIALELLEARRRTGRGRLLSAESFAHAKELRRLGNVRRRANELRSDSAQGALHELLYVLDDKIRGEEGIAGRIFMGASPAGKEWNLGDQSAAAAARLNQSSDAWRHQETQLSFLRDVARALLREDQDTVSPNEERAVDKAATWVPGPRPNDETLDRTPNFRASTWDGKRFPHPIDRAAHDFLRGLLLPWRTGRLSLSDGQEVPSLWSAARLLFFHKTPAAALDPTVKYIRTLEVFEAHDDERGWFYRAGEEGFFYIAVTHHLSEERHDPVLYFHRLPNLSEWERSCLVTAVTEDGLHEPARFFSNLKQTNCGVIAKWRDWLTECRCPTDVIKAGTNADGEPRIRRLFATECAVHHNHCCFFGNTWGRPYFSLEC